MNSPLNKTSHRLRKRLITLLVLVLATAAAMLAAWLYWTHRYDGLIAAAAQQNNLDPALVRAIVYEESFFSAGARSSQNAVGLMQVTPVVAQHWVEATHARSLADAIAAIPNQTEHRAYGIELGSAGDRSRRLAEAEHEPLGWIRKRQVIAQSGGPLGLQLTHRSSCKVRSFPADRAREPAARARRRLASRSLLLGMSIAQAPLGSGDSAGRWGRKGSAQGEGWT